MKAVVSGYENFKEVIEKEIYYVDKTNLIKELLKEKVALFTRPRRFGKTLNMSMLKYFFSNKEESAALFEGLEISKDKEAMEHMNQYPVIFITLKDFNKMEFSSQVHRMKAVVSTIFNSFGEVLKGDCLSESERNKFEHYTYEERIADNDLDDSLHFLCQCLYKYYGKKVILLVDEYDVPLQSGYLYGYYDQSVDLIRGVLSNALKSNDYLEKGILTGCLRISKESIFTGLNNLRIYPISSRQNSKYFGFTREDVDKLLNYYDLDSYKDVVREWYDGYLFGDTEIYNPWSVVQCVMDILNKEKDCPKSYWANTSSNDIVYRYVNESNQEMKKDFELLISGKSIEKEIKPELTYREMDDINNIYSFLLFTGYLKIKENLGNNIYTLEIPNKEIQYIYEKIFSEWFRAERNAQSVPFVNSLLEGDELKARRILNKLLQQTISYYDSNESFYHGLLIGLLNTKSFDFNIKSNRESGDGRYDIALIPSDFDDIGVIIECKHSAAKENLVEDSKMAVDQIIEKEYIEGMKIDGYTKFIGYGISFYKKNCFISKL